MRNRSLFLSLLLVGAFASAEPVDKGPILGTEGIIEISGTLLSTTCAMQMDTAYQNVDLGTISAKGLTKVGARSSAVPIKLHFSGCLVGAYAIDPGQQRHQVLETQAVGVNTDWYLSGRNGVVVTLVGEPDLSNLQLLKANGDTQGIGIRFTDSKGGALTVNQPNKAYPLNPGENTLVFFASIESTQAAIRAGDFRSIVNVRLSYL